MPDVLPTLIRARELLAEYGLAKHNFSQPDGGLCLRGAINVAAWGRAEISGCLCEGPAFELLRDCEAAMGFPSHSGECLGDAGTWNNGSRTTLDDVLDRFDQAIEDLSMRDLSSDDLSITVLTEEPVIRELQPA